VLFCSSAVEDLLRSFAFSMERSILQIGRALIPVPATP
jgi:hypothetical protein